MEHKLRLISILLVLVLSIGFCGTASAQGTVYIFGNPNVYLNGNSTENGDGEYFDTVDAESFGDDGYSNDQDSSYGMESSDTDAFSDDEDSSDGSGSTTMYVTGQPFARLRADESTSNPYLAKMPYGSKVTYLSSNTVDGVLWSNIIYNGQTGYCMTKYLGTENPYDGVMPHPKSFNAAFGSNLLQRGNHYSDVHVKNLQLCLIEGGFLSDGPGADGLFGSSTQKALMKYQKARGLEPVGRAGDTTKKRLWNEYRTFLEENGVIQ